MPAFDAVLPAPIHLPEGAVDRLIGVDFSLDEITDTLTAIGCRLDVQTDGWQVTPPSWRPDLVDAPSLAEEVARIVGYDLFATFCEWAGVNKTSLPKGIEGGSIAALLTSP